MRQFVIEKREENQPVMALESQKPSFGVDEVLVRNYFIGLNKGDAIRRSRALFPPQQEPPFVLGFEGAGEIIDVGENVANYSIGDFVGYLIPSGAYSEVVAVKASNLVPKPANVPMETMAASCCIGLTAVGLLRLVEKPKSKSMLVHGATGSVGSALIQIGNARGFDMRATVTSETDKKNVHIPSGGLLGLDRDFPGEKCNRNAGTGVDVIFDCIGDAVSAGNNEALNDHGMLLYFGSASGHATFNGLDVLMRSLRIQGFVVFDCAETDTIRSEMASELYGYLESGILKPEVDVITPDKITDALQSITDRKVRRRIVVDVRPA